MNEERKLLQEWGKVIHQPADMMVLKDIAKGACVLTPQFRSLSREPLSDAEIMRLGVLNCCNEASAFKPFGVARAIEKTHGITGGPK